MAKWPIFTVQQLVQSGVLERPMDGNHGSIHPKTADFVQSGIPFIMASDLKGGRVDLETCAFISEEQAARLAKGFSKSGDVLLSHKATLGRTAIVQENRFPYVMLTPQVTYYRIRDPQRLNNRFLKYYFNSRSFLDVFEAWAGGGSTRAYLGITAQQGLPIPLPPLEIQRSIADLVGPLDDKIDLNRRTNETLEAMARAIFKDWFVDFGPTRAKMERRAPYLAPEIWALFSDRLGDDGKPAGWQDGSVYEIANVLYGAPFASSQFNSERQGDPLLRIRDLVNENPGVWTPEVHPKGYKVKAGDIVVGMDGEFRAYLWGGVEAWLNQRVCVFAPKQDFSAAFVRNSIVGPLADVEATEIATTVIHLGKNDIDRFRVLLPSKLVIKSFNSLVQPLYDQIVQNKQQARILAATRDLLLPKLMSGEIQVHEAKKIAEAAE